MKRLLPIFALAAVMSACVKQPQEPDVVRFSVLGDSYSAYLGTVDPKTNDVYQLYDSIGVTGAEQMWWHKVATEKGWVVDRNNSYSGALVCNYNYVNYYGPHSFLRRMDDLGNPNVIFIFGATNDACAHNGDNVPVVSLGDYIYADWTEEQLCTFRPALAYLFDNLKRMYPSAQLYFMLDMNLGSGGISNDRKTAFIESIHHITNYYNVSCIDLYDIHKSHWHPDAEGQRSIAEQVLDYLDIELL